LRSLDVVGDPDGILLTFLFLETTLTFRELSSRLKDAGLIGGRKRSEKMNYRVTED
jgi:hypothetical protein